MEDNLDLNWRKSSFSGANGGGCIEVGNGPDVIVVRDTRDREGPVLAFGSQAWETFAVKVKAEA
jgi:hypothetical protein